MRTIRINTDRTVDEIDEEPFEWLGEDVEWDSMSIAKGVDIWVRDDGLFDSDVVAMVAGRPTPLPAFVTGADGERTVAATVSVEQVLALID